MAKMYGKFIDAKQNVGGRVKSSQRQLEFKQALRDSDLTPLTGHVNNQVCGPHGQDCGETTCRNYYYGAIDDWDTYSLLSIFETYPLVYSVETNNK